MADKARRGKNADLERAANTILNGHVPVAPADDDEISTVYLPDDLPAGPPALSGKSRVVLTIEVDGAYTPQEAARRFYDQMVLYGVANHLIRVTDEEWDNHFYLRNGELVDFDQERANAGL